MFDEDLDAEATPTTLSPAVGSWSPAVVILGENEPQRVHRCELTIEVNGQGEWGYALHWWPTEDDAEHYTRSVHRLLSLDRDGMRGQHAYLTGGDLGVFALNPD